MAIAGRKPKSYAVKKKEGNPGRRVLIPGVEVPLSRFAPPVPLGEVGMREWHRILSVAYWLRETEAAALADRCLCFERMVACEKDIDERGMVTRTRNGKVANPSVRFAKGYRQSLQRYDVELGLTSASRTRLGPGEGNSIQMDPLEAALCGGVH